MSEKPSIPFAETVALLLKNAGVNADEQLSRTLAMAIAIKFQETQAERDEAIWQQAAERIRALAATPPGMVCVPVEPTKEMCEAAEALPAIDGVNDLPLAKAGWSPRAIQNLKRYRAMLAAHGGKE